MDIRPFIPGDIPKRIDEHGEVVVFVIKTVPFYVKGELYPLWLDSVKMNPHARSISSKVIVRHRDRHTHLSDCFAWTTKVVGNKPHVRF